MPDLKYALTIAVYAMALAVLAGSAIGLGRRLIARGEAGLTEAGYFLAGCALIIWAIR
jgi:hypothetical protein